MGIYVTAITATSGQLSKVLYHICRWLHVQTRTIIWTHLEQNECKLRCEGGNHNLHRKCDIPEGFSYISEE